MIKSVTGEQLARISKDDLETGSPDAVPGQIPFYKFEEEELESFDPKLSDNSTAEDYLKSVILEARQQPDIVRASLPKVKTGNRIEWKFLNMPGHKLETTLASSS